MKLATRRFFTSRRLWALLIVPAMLSTAYAAAAVVPTAQNAPPAPSFWPRLPGATLESATAMPGVLLG